MGFSVGASEVVRRPLESRRRGCRQALVPRFALPIGNKALEVGDANGLAFLAKNASRLALIFDPIYMTSNGGQRPCPRAPF